MKLKFWDRVILFAGALVTIAAGIAFFVAGLQIHGEYAESMSVGLRVLSVLAGILLMAFGGYLVVFPHLYSESRSEFVCQKTETGELRIAVKAIENLVMKCVELHEEIDLLSTRVSNSRDGVVVQLSVSLADNISIPLAVASLQKQIKQYLIASSGIEVREVRVSVETTQDGVTITAESEEDDDFAYREKKLPLHQRLFGTADQPAIVPEPPKEEAETTADEAQNPNAASESEPVEAAPEQEDKRNE